VRSTIQLTFSYAVLNVLIAGNACKI